MLSTAQIQILKERRTLAILVVCEIPIHPIQEGKLRNSPIQAPKHWVMQVSVTLLRKKERRTNERKKERNMHTNANACKTVRIVVCFFDKKEIFVICGGCCGGKGFGVMGGIIIFGCFAFFQHALDATLWTFPSNFQHALDATLLAFSSNFQHALDATV